MIKILLCWSFLEIARWSKLVTSLKYQVLSFLGFVTYTQPYVFGCDQMQWLCIHLPFFFYEIPFHMMMISLVVELMYAAGVSSSGLTPDPLTLFSHAYWVLHPHRYNPIKLPCTCFSYCQGGKPFWMAAMQLRSLSKHQILWDREGNHKHNFEGGDMLTNWKYDMSIDMLGKKSSPGFGLSSKLVSFLVCCCSLLLYSCCSRIFSHTGAP